MDHARIQAEQAAETGTAVAVGRRAIAAEAAGLIALGEALGGPLGPPFAAALDRMARAEGRVIVCGMGKSGHVARKIAATLASTGTPAQFVHPAEASHGDLGMITERDVALVLSHSGETRELADVVAHAKRVGVGLIAITGGAGSTLARAADVVLLLPGAPEASRTVAVPSTSTTMALALGDALAVALMEGRAFTPERFRAFHPGGSLGAGLVTVADLMASGEALPLVGPDTPMAGVIRVMSEKGFGAAGVVEDGALVGVITDGDLRRHVADGRGGGLLARTACEVATGDPLTIAPDRLAQEALARMNAGRSGRKVSFLFVTADPPPAPPLGLIHLHDCLRAGVDGRLDGRLGADMAAPDPDEPSPAPDPAASP